MIFSIYYYLITDVTQIRHFHFYEQISTHHPCLPAGRLVEEGIKGKVEIILYAITAVQNRLSSNS